MQMHNSTVDTACAHKENEPQVRKSFPEAFVARILCVDDDPQMIALKQRILESAGYTVTACISAEEAKCALEAQTFDAVVTDWRLGDGVGRSVVQSAKAHSSGPVIVVSGYVSEAFQAAEPLADLYLEKPVNPVELIKVMETLLSRRASSNTSAAHHPGMQTASPVSGLSS